MHQNFLVHAPGDAVGVAVRDIAPGPAIRSRVMDGGGDVELDVVSEIPLGHKIALRDIAAGERVVKYGVPIGKASRDIRTGEHVHVHNLRGERWA